MLITKLSRAETQAWRQAPRTFGHGIFWSTIKYNRFQSCCPLLIGPIKLENMFYLKLIIYTYWALLWMSTATSSQVPALPPAKPRTRVPLSFSEPLLTDNAASPWVWTSRPHHSHCYWLTNQDYSVSFYVYKSVQFYVRTQSRQSPQHSKLDT